MSLLSGALHPFAGGVQCAGVQAGCPMGAEIRRAIHIHIFLSYGIFMYMSYVAMLLHQNRSPEFNTFQQVPIFSCTFGKVVPQDGFFFESS